ncbi:MAG: FAD-binding oxidoreductase [Gammaproteobacteria bacterium]|nr:FAD-binding oxidoreductase [Gammaproteobacteria bacterium]
MRRWNGWGDDAHDYVLRANARALLLERLGPGTPPRDASLDEALQRVPASRLQDGSRFNTGAEARLRHTRGQSFPDWLATRFGRLGPFPDGVAFPESHDDAVEVLANAKRAGATVIPYGGGTSVVGHLNVPRDDRPAVSVSLERMDKLLDLDETCWLARFGGGTPGPALEKQLRERGYVLGHFPQSWEYSTVGGWVVTRSSGQQSLRYGRIEQMFDSGRLATPRGEMTVGGVPASAAGPDLREFVMGSEGRLGLLTEAVVRVRPLPQHESFHAVFFPDWAHGFAAVRALAQSGLPLSMLRLSNANETETHLTLAGEGAALRWLRRYLGWRGAGAGRCMSMLGVTGGARETRYALDGAREIVKRHRGVWIGTAIGNRWAHNRFHGVYVRNTAWEAGYAIDTVETAINWNKATGLMQAVEKAAADATAKFGERVHAFTHLSHVYRQGCSVYSSFIFRAAPSLEENMERWAAMKKAVSETIVVHGGTISHQHGVGVDHAPYLPAEKGPLGMDLIKAVAAELDPKSMMNPGKLFA